MAYLASCIIDFDKPDSTDIVKFRFFVVPDGTVFSRTLPATEIDITEETTYSVDLAELITEEGVYDVYIVSVDAAGNESDPAELQDTHIDFTPPPAPVNVRRR